MNIAYVGTHGGNLRGTTDINQPTLGDGDTTDTNSRDGSIQQNCPSSYPGGLGSNPAQCFPYLGQIEVQFPNEISNYNAMQATLTERVSHGLQFTLGYTFSHALDEAQAFRTLPTATWRTPKILGWTTATPPSTLATT